MSDIAGQDIHCHEGDPHLAVREVVNWLRAHSSLNSVPGGSRAAEEFESLRSYLPSILRHHQLSPDEMTFGDYSELVLMCLEQR